MEGRSWSVGLIDQRRDDVRVRNKDNRGSELEGNEDQFYQSPYKWFVTFYFTNFSAQISNFYLRKGFEVCGMLEDVVVPSKQNVNGEFYGFVRYAKVKDVGKLLKAVNVVCFRHFRVRAKVARFDRSFVPEGRQDRMGEGEYVGGSEKGRNLGGGMKKHDGEGEKIASGVVNGEVRGSKVVGVEDGVLQR